MTPLYSRILKDDYNRLPQAVQDLHDLTDHKVYSGMCDVVRGKSMLNRILASILGFPVGGAKQKLHISFEAKGEKEHWRRCFGGRRFISAQWEKNGLLYERVRFIVLVFAVLADTQKLQLQLKQVLFFGIPVGWLFRPQVRAIEYEDNGRFCMDAEVHLPITGLLIHYYGWVVPDLSRV